ncbi:MAG: glycosyltransferase [Firmicutes bacterium]|nr:glycosyltransferase [Bacillota bacterium]
MSSEELSGGNSMQVIFIISDQDNIMIVKSLFEIARWLKENKDIKVLMYIPEIKNYNILPKASIEIHWLTNRFSASEIPEADIILSTQLDLLRQLSLLSRGELVYLNNTGKKQEISADIRVIGFNSLKPGIPDRLYLQEEKKRDKIVVAGDSLDKKGLSKIISALEIAASSITHDGVVILNSPEKYFFDTEIDYYYEDIDNKSIIGLLSRGFYLIYLGRNEFPLLPLWSMAAGVLTISINLSERKWGYPLELSKYTPLELALIIIRSYKMGQWRNSLLVEAERLVKEYKLNKVGEDWAGYFEDVLQGVNPAADSKEVDKQQKYKSQINYSKRLTKNPVDLIIVNYNTLDYLKKCLASIKSKTREDYNIIVVDNGSSDGSKEYLKKQENILLIENKENLGYARACNQGIIAGSAEYIVLLNSDIEVTTDWLGKMIKAAAGDDVAVVGPKLINKEGLIVGAGVDSLRDDFKPRGWKELDRPGVYDQQEDLLSVGGACYLIKRDLLPVLGLFDEGYFFYFEELDYSLRAREKGYRVVYCPQARVIHHHEGSLKSGNKNNKLKRDRYFSASRKRFKSKWGEVIAGSEKRHQKRKIIVAGLIPWDFRQQRPQHLMRNLAQLGYEILYLNPVCGSGETIEVEENIHIYSPHGYGTVLYNLEHNRGDRLGQEINSLLRELNFENCIVLLNAPYWTPLLQFWEYSLLIYDCIDNYTEFEDLVHHEAVIKKAEQKLLNLADLVLTSSTGLYEEKKALNDNTYLVPNGVDTGYFNYNYKPVIKPDDIPDSEKIIGYYGAISSWFDVELVKSLAVSLPEVAVVLIGEVSTDISHLSNLSNVSLLGEKPYHLLADYLYYFDLAIIPFIKNNLTLMSDPVKLYEYLAAGKPVLTTELPEVKKFEKLITIAKDKTDFISQAADLINNDVSEDNREDRYKLIKNKTWLRRAEKINSLIYFAYYDLYPQEEELEDIIEGDKGSLSVELPEDELLSDNLVKIEEPVIKKNSKNWLSILKEWLTGESSE